MGEGGDAATGEAGEEQRDDVDNPQGVAASPMSRRWEPVLTRASSLASATALLWAAAPACALDLSSLGERPLPMTPPPLPLSEAASSPTSTTVSRALMQLAGVSESLRANAAAAAAAAVVAPPPAGVASTGERVYYSTRCVLTG